MEGTLKKLETFLVHHDGVHVQYANRDEINDGMELRQQPKLRADGKQRDVPEHFHHNWRFNEN